MSEDAVDFTPREERVAGISDPTEFTPSDTRVVQKRGACSRARAEAKATWRKRRRTDRVPEKLYPNRGSGKSRRGGANLTDEDSDGGLHPDAASSSAPAATVPRSLSGPRPMARTHLAPETEVSVALAPPHDIGARELVPPVGHAHHPQSPPFPRPPYAPAEQFSHCHKCQEKGKLATTRPTDLTPGNLGCRRRCGARRAREGRRRQLRCASGLNAPRVLHSVALPAHGCSLSTHGDRSLQFRCFAS